MEKWKIIKDFPNYSISDHGRVRREKTITNTKKGKILKNILGNRYFIIALNHNGIEKSITIHKLVAEAFIGRPTKRHQVNHKDGNKLNNHISNLEYLTGLQNMRHAYKLNLIKSPKGDKHWNSKLTEIEVIEIRKLHKQGVKQRKLAIMFNITFKNIHMIVRNKTWTHI